MKIYETLIKVIAEMKNPIKEKENSFFKSKYATLDVICDDMRKIFAKHNVAIVQQPTINAQGLFVLRATAFSEDETLDLGDYLIKPAKDDPQGYGSAITYARRYQLCSLMGIAAEDDDDGNHASGKIAQTAQVRAPKPANAQTEEKKETAGDIMVMRAELMHQACIGANANTATEEGKEQVREYMKKWWGMASIAQADETCIRDLHKKICSK